ncbi:MAG TPA: BT_3928 family protein [Bacteroidales bacterium]|nr:BT_3928 family protein [Bacteroidales bacterium]
MRKLNQLSRIILGLVFIFSGFVKAVDPLGSMYKFNDYFTAFDLEFLSVIALPLAILLSTVEFVIGFSLLYATKRKITAWVTLIFMSFFTILTLFLAIFNPVSDCGCFGDAIIMTNWETFWKNVVLMIFTIVIFVHRNKYEVQWKSINQWIAIAIPFIFSITLSLYCYFNLPILDFRPYHIGTHIPEKMIIPEDAPKAEYETILLYEKNGKVKEFTLENLPDSTWQWVETKNELISEGYIPPIHDFSIQTPNGNDITDIVLNDTKFTFLMVAYDLNKTSTKNIDKINKLAEYCKESGKCNFICLTASVESVIQNFKDKTGAPYMFYASDEITLKTIVRANPGIVLIKKGTILDKWHHRNIPTIESMETMYLNNDKYKNERKGSENEVLAGNE